MPTARTRIAIALATTAVVALLLGVLGGGDPYHPRSAKPKPAAAARDVDEGEDRLAPPGEPAARQTARRFLAAFADYEIAASTPRVRRTITATSTPPLAASLLGRPPRSVPGTRPAGHAVIAELSLAGVAGGGSLQYLTQLQRGPVSESFSLLIAPGQGAWRVSRVSGS